jgi:hypothetical protein
MGRPNHYSKDIAERCRTLLVELRPLIERDSDAIRRYGGPLTTTFLLAMGTPMLVFPLERLTKPFEDHMKQQRRVASDRGLDPALTAKVESVFSKSFAGAPFGKVDGWSCVQGWKPFNLAHHWPNEILDQLASPEAAKTAAGAKVGFILEVLRNALAHGGVYYLDRHGRNTDGEAAMLAFVGATTPGVIQGFDVLRVHQDDFYDFLLAWSDWLSGSGISGALGDGRVFAA